MKRSYTDKGEYIPPYGYESIGIKMPNIPIVGQDEYNHLRRSRPPNASLNQSYNHDQAQIENEYDYDVYNTQLENSGWNDLGYQQVEESGDYTPQLHQGGGIPLYTGGPAHRVNADNFNPNSVPSTIALAGVGALSLGRYFRGGSQTPDMDEAGPSEVPRPRAPVRQKSKNFRRSRTNPRPRAVHRYDDEEQYREEGKSESEAESDQYTGKSRNSHKNKERVGVYNEVTKPPSSSEDESSVTTAPQAEQDLSESFYDSCNVYATEPVQSSSRRKMRQARHQ